MDGVRAKLGKRIIQALKMNDDGKHNPPQSPRPPAAADAPPWIHTATAAGVHYAAIDVLGCLMQPMHNYYDLVQEQLNKRSLLTSRPFLTRSGPAPPRPAPPCPALPHHRPPLDAPHLTNAAAVCALSPAWSTCWASTR